MKTPEEKKAREIWDECEKYWGTIGDKALVEGNKQEILEIIAQALKETRSGINHSETEQSIPERVLPPRPTEEEIEKGRAENCSFSDEGEDWERGARWAIGKIYGDETK